MQGRHVSCQPRAAPKPSRGFQHHQCSAMECRCQAMALACWHYALGLCMNGNGFGIGIGIGIGIGVDDAHFHAFHVFPVIVVAFFLHFSLKFQSFRCQLQRFFATRFRTGNLWQLVLTWTSRFHQLLLTTPYPRVSIDACWASAPVVPTGRPHRHSPVFISRCLTTRLV